MTAEKSILGIVPTIHSSYLLRNVLKKRKKKRIVGSAIDTIIGTDFIRAESESIGGL